MQPEDDDTVAPRVPYVECNGIVQWACGLALVEHLQRGCPDDPGCIC